MKKLTKLLKDYFLATDIKSDKDYHRRFTKEMLGIERDKTFIDRCMDDFASLMPNYLLIGGTVCSIFSNDLDSFLYLALLGESTRLGTRLVERKLSERDAKFRKKVLDGLGYLNRGETISRKRNTEA